MAQQGQSASGSGSPSQGFAEVRHGMRSQRVPTGNITVGQMRESYKNMYKMPGDSKAQIGGNVVDDNYVLQPGDTVEFYRNSGEKG